MPRVYRGVLMKLRHQYRVAWRREWPHSDDFLAELWLEVRGDAGRARNHAILPTIYAETLTLMRENDEFTAPYVCVPTFQPLKPRGTPP
jgi:hypothetical protein